VIGRHHFLGEIKRHFFGKSARTVSDSRDIVAATIIPLAQSDNPSDLDRQ
jgi:hypothetical protein